jgi:hypothetical protein
MRLEISQWSSSSNIPGNYILLEIIPTFVSLELVKNKKEKGGKNNGYILGYPEIFIHSLVDKRAGIVKIKQIFDEDVVRIEEENNESIEN